VYLKTSLIQKTVFIDIMSLPEIDVKKTSPEEAHDRWEDITNLQEDTLRDVKDSKRNDIYLEKAEGNQEGNNPPLEGGPLEDAITLASTPRSEWTRDHVKEAEEARNFLARTKPQFEQSEGEPLMPEGPKIHKDEMSLIRWGFDPDTTDSFP
jgi:hypothetical protein